MERKAWTEEEDRVLKRLHEEGKMRKWSQIAKAMNTQFGMSGRNGKQCRQRYHNHLDSAISKRDWNQQELAELVRLHNTMGNRWAEISRNLPGRSENCVKNKLYSILRRGLKCINWAIKSKLKRYKQLQISIVYKVVQACENKYSRKALSKEMTDTFQIKKQIIYYGIHYNQHSSPEDISAIKHLIDQIKHFEKGTLPSRNQKKEDVSLPSEEIESSEFRDNIADLRGSKKTSLHNLMVPPQNEEQLPQTKPSLFSSLHNIKKLSSRESNKEMEFHEQRVYDLLPAESIKSFQFPQYDNAMRSPRPFLCGDSPYFDELRQRSSFNSWSLFLPQ